MSTAEIKLKCIKSTRGRRFFQRKCPLVNENTKNTILIENGKGGSGKQFLTDMKLLKKPFVTNYTLPEKMFVFEDNTKLERLFEKLDSSLFVMTSHTKKRPNNVIMGRAFDHQVLDMYEFEICEYAPMSTNSADKFDVGAKPILIFTGFPNDNENMRNFYVKTLLIDLFRGPTIKNVNKEGLSHCIHFQLIDNEQIAMTVCKIDTVSSEFNQEVTDVKEIGCSCILKMKRSQLPDPDVWKKALKKPDSLRTKKRKAVEKDVFGNVFNRVHLGKGDRDKLAQLSSDKYHSKMRKLDKRDKPVEKMEVLE